MAQGCVSRSIPILALRLPPRQEKKSLCLLRQCGAISGSVRGTHPMNCSMRFAISVMICNSLLISAAIRRPLQPGRERIGDLNRRGFSRYWPLGRARFAADGSSIRGATAPSPDDRRCASAAETGALRRRSLAPLSHTRSAQGPRPHRYTTAITWQTWLAARTTDWDAPVAEGGKCCEMSLPVSFARSVAN